MTSRQRRFVDEYLLDLNATQAAIRAGYSAHTAEQQGSRLLGNAEIAQAVRGAQFARSERVQITQDDVLRGLQREATLTGEGSSHAARVSALAGIHRWRAACRRDRPPFSLSPPRRHGLVRKGRPAIERMAGRSVSILPVSWTVAPRHTTNAPGPRAFPAN
jgi:hypothetical protein